MSMFGYLLLYEWCCAGRRVIMRRAGWQDGKPHLFCKEGAFVLSDAAFEKERETPGVM